MRRFGWPLVAALMLVVALLISAAPAAADGVDGDSRSATEGGFRWGPGNPGESWVQFDDDLRTYDCNWVDGTNIICRERGGGDYHCVYSGPEHNTFWCNPTNVYGNPGLAPVAPVLARGIANRGQVSRPPPPPPEEDPPC